MMQVKDDKSSLSDVFPVQAAAHHTTADGMTLKLWDVQRLSRYAVIVGRGRSGSNFLLSLLDLSPLTHTRNEPHSLQNAAMSVLPRGWFVTDKQRPQLETHWDRAIVQAACSMGERDHMPKGPKYYIRPIPRALGLYKMLDGTRARRMLRRLIPSLRGAEWPLPRWVCNYDELHRSLPVLKFGPVPGWIEWVLAHRREARIVHIARHPGGFLNSWRNRWLLLHDRQEVHRKTTARLKAVAEALPEWSRRFGDIDAMSVEEAELWFWIYTNEVIHNAGRNLPNYMLVVYERLAANTVKLTRDMYEFCGLPWTDEIERAVRRESSDSISISNSWQEKLSTQQIDLVNRMLAESSIQSWWR